jgi:hypothetical protein
VYTSLMTLLEAQNRLVEETEVVIDWSKTPETDINTMIEWIRTYPRRKDVHVYLGAQRHKPQGRQLQNALQALGCTVTNRSLQPA